MAATAASLCESRLVLCHEGGYSSSYVPYCGLAVIESLAGVRTAVDAPIALAMVDIKVLDHFVVGGDAAMSFAERGLL